MKISEEDIKRIIDLFENTNKTFQSICKEAQISRTDLQNVLEKYYLEKGVKNPLMCRPQKKYKNRLEIEDEEVYKLREERLTYREITEIFTNRGQKISLDSIRTKCKRIYQKKGQEEPKAKRKEQKQNILEEDIYQLREQGLTYEAIAEIFTKQGKNISTMSVLNKCKEIYIKKGQEEPKAKRKEINQKMNATDEKKEQPEKNMDDKDLQKKIVNLIITKKASLEQIKKIAEIYEVDLDEIFNNSIDER